MPDQQQRIREKQAALAALRPLAAQGLAQLEKWYDVELTYSSNAIEGSMLTRSETAIVLEDGVTVSGKPLRDHLEATGHRDALLYIRSLATDDSPVRESDVRTIHRLVLQRIDPEEAGRYSRHVRMIAGSDLLLPPPAQIAPLMSDFSAWLAAAPLHPQKAFDAHEKLVTIHPFSDGNGRTARLLMNLLLLKCGYPPVVIQPEDKPAYFDALDATRAGDRGRYDGFMSDRLEMALDHFLRILSPDLESTA